MAWSNPRTWVVGDMANAALLNQYIRDNLNFLFNGQCYATHVAVPAKSIPNNALTLVDVWDTTDFDTDSMGPGGATWSKINITTPGKYFVSASVPWSSNATGGRQINICVDRTTIAVLGENVAISQKGAGATSYSTGHVQTVGDFQASDKVFVQVLQTSGAALTFANQPTACFLHLCRIGA